MGTASSFTITVNPTATVNAVPNQVVCNGAATAAVNFSSPTTGGTIVYNWTNNTTSIGLAASGSGDIASFTATNTTNAVVTATITVTPAYTNGGTTCNGTPRTFTITVNPTPTVDVVPNQVVCNGAPTAPVYFNGNMSGTICATANENGTAVLTAPAGTVITRIIFASYGTPNGACGSYTIGGCHAANSMSVVSNLALGQNSVSIPANNITFGDPCGGTVKRLYIQAMYSPVAGQAFNWTNNTTSIGLAASGTGNIASFTAINPGTGPVTATITVTPTYTNGGTTCTGTARTFTITVNPTPTVNAVPNQVVCNGAPTTAVNFSSPTTGGTIVYNWTNNTTSIGLAASGTGNIASFTAVNTGTAPVTATITVTPTYTNGGTSCVGPSTTFTITVNPTATVNAVPNQVVCNNTPTAAVNFSSPTTGGTIVYNWTNNTTSIGLVASGTGNIASFTATNATNAPVVATITVTPTYTNGGVSCVGTPITFTITVNPTATVNPVPNQVVCNNAPTAAINFTSPTTGGTIVYNWTNNTTSIGLAASGTGDIASFTATNVTNGPVTATITVTPTYTNGGVSCVGTPSTFTITVNPTATIDPVASQVVCNNTVTAAINFTSPTVGGTIVYNWTNNTPSIGLAAAGTGNITNFTATNTTNAPVVATITVTPTYTNGGVSCVGTPISFTITVNPTATVDPVANQLVCNNTATAAVNFTSPTTGGTIVYNWTNNDPFIGLAGSGTGNIASFIATNMTNAPETATITVTPTYTNGGLSCVGTPMIFTITVNPTATIDPVANQVLCNGANSTPINFTSPTTGGTIIYNWTNSDPSIGLAASGTGNIPTFVAVNPGPGPVTATVTVTPTYTNGAVSCVGTPISFTITVNPPPVVDPVASQVVCNGAPTANINFTTPVSGGIIVFNWTNNTPSIGLAAAGTGDILSFTATNATNVPVVATITVIMSYTNGGITCVSLPVTFTITVNPTPTVNQPANQALCAGVLTAPVNFTGTVAGTVFNWTNNNTAIGLAASGTGDIPAFIAVNATNLPITATITVTPSYTNAGVTCTGPFKTFTITVNPVPTVAPVSNKAYCTGATTQPIPFNGTAGNAPGTIFNWTNSNPAIGLPASGTGDIPSFVTTNATNGPLVATITVTPVGPTGCVGTPITFTITVNPAPVVNPVTGQVLCNGSPTAVINFTSPTTGPTGALSFQWTNSAPSIGLAANGTGNIPSFIATNTGLSPVIAILTVTAVYNNAGITCIGNSQTFTITVNPTPTVNPVANQVLCNGSSTAAVNFTGSVFGTIYNWTNNNPSIGLAASGAGNIASFVATNATNAPVVATITVTPNYTNGVTCPGTPITFTITVNPIPSVNPPASQVVCAGVTVTQTFTGPVAGTVYSWTNTNTAIGLGASGTGNLNFTATNTTGAPITGTITVTPSYTNAGGTCTGTPQTFTITVNPIPTVNAVLPQVLCNGAATAAVTFTGAVAGTVYSWTNSNTSIGLAAAGTGNIASFTATNITNVVQTATITVTPSYTNGAVTCTGTPRTFTITVNPTPSVTTIANQTVCNGTATTAVTIAGPVAGTVYSWTNNNPGIGLAAAGTNTIPSFIAINTGSTPVTATITVTPSFTNGGITCTGATSTFTITVNPTATVNQPANQLLCNGANTTAVTFSGLPPGSVYNWTNSNTAIGLAAAGTGNIPSFVATNTTNAPITATITVTPTASGCGGGPVSFTITVNPTPSVNAIANQSLCAGASTAAVTISGPVANTAFTWTNNNTTIGLGASGIGNIPSFVTVNPTTSPVTATITVTPAYTNGGVTCTGAPVSFTITVNPLPNIIFSNAPPRMCITDTIAILVASPAGGTWSGTGVVGNTFNPAVAGLGVTNVTYTVSNGGCTTSRSQHIVVHDCKERHNAFQEAMRIWPNPNQGRFSLQFNSDVYKEFKVKVVNARGQEVGSYEFKNLVYGQILPFDLSRLADGQYFLYVYNSKESGVFPLIIVR